MSQVDDTTYTVLALLRDRPLSLHEVVPLLDLAPNAAAETVRKLVSDGLVKRINNSPSQPRELVDDEPLTLTFRGMMRL